MVAVAALWALGAGSAATAGEWKYAKPSSSGSAASAERSSPRADAKPTSSGKKLAWKAPASRTKPAVVRQVAASESVSKSKAVAKTRLEDAADPFDDSFEEDEAAKIVSSRAAQRSRQLAARERGHVRRAAAQQPRRREIPLEDASPIDDPLSETEDTVPSDELPMDEPADEAPPEDPDAMADEAPAIDEEPMGDLPAEDDDLTPPSKDRRPSLEEELAKGPGAPKGPCPSPRDLKRIHEITDDITAEEGEFPQECPLGDEPYQPRCWAMTTYTWKASGVCHKPLYFEQVAVERYGHTWPLLQPIMSGAHFFLTVPILPYKMGIEPPGECIYPLGYYNPGSCAPYMIYPIPITIRAGLLQAGAWVGGIYLIP